MGSSSSEGETVISEGKWDEYVKECYDKLKTGLLKANGSDFSFRCPFCYRKKRVKYSYKELIRHAYGHGRGSKAGDIKKKARHTALEKYAEKYLKNKFPEISSTKEAVSSQGDRPPSIAATLKFHVDRKHVKSKFDPDTDPNEKFVWPWFGVLANLPVQVKDGKSVMMESSSKIRDELAKQGFGQVKVHSLWNYYNGFSGFALVEFGKDWSSFANAMKFEKSFEDQFRGKRYWKSNGQQQKEGHIYGWIARLDDYESRLIIGIHLRKFGDITTIKQKQDEDQRKSATLVGKLTNTLEDKAEHIKEMQQKYKMTTSLCEEIMSEKDKIIEDFNKGMINCGFHILFLCKLCSHTFCNCVAMNEMEQRRRDQYKKIISEQARSRAKLASRKRELTHKEKALDRIEDQFESVKEKILREKEMVRFLGSLYS